MNVSLPSTLTSLGGYAFDFCSNLKGIVIPDGVTMIQDDTFRSCTSMEYAVIPDSVTEIKAEAFQSCFNLKDVVIPKKVTKIGNRAFESCTALTEVVIPEGVTEIGENAFTYCTSASTIYIPASLTSIGRFALNYCTGLQDILVSPDNPRYYDLEGVLFDREANSILQFPMSRTGTYAIPDGIQAIEGEAFWYCTGLKEVSIPDSVKTIGGGAFQGCEGLEKITIPDSVQTFGDAVFDGCYRLKSVHIPYGTTRIGIGMCQNCTALTEIDIPNSVTTIEQCAFQGCEGLTSVYLPDSVVTMENAAFSNCPGLTSVRLSNNLTIIRDGDFVNCTGLTSVQIPAGVTTIEDAAFDLCENLRYIVIPDSVTSIGNWSFAYCNSLSNVYYTGSEDQWKSIFFDSGNEPLLNAVIQYNYTGYKDLTLTGQPQNYVGKVNSPVTFSVSAEGDGLSYQWQYSDNGGKKWTNTVTTAVYSTKLSANRDGRLVRCIVTDQYGNSVTSDAAAMRIYKLAIIKQPADFMGKSGEPVTFYVEATGDGLSYQWQYSDNGGKKWTNTVKTSAYATKLSTNRNGRLVRCIVTDQYGNAVTSSTVSMKLYKLTITQQPVDYVGKVNSPVTFTVLAEGSGLTYKWQFSDNGGKSWTTSSVTSPVYATKLNANRDGRLVRCIVTDLYGTAVKSDTVSMKIG